MNHIHDLTGEKFGFLTVVGRGEDYVYPSGKRKLRWLCQCKCGNTKSIQSGTLLSGKAKSCGCLQKKIASDHMKAVTEKQKVDITGERFGILTAIEPVDRKNYNGCTWRCVCDCGNEKIASVKELRSGNVKSCGCLRKTHIQYMTVCNSSSGSRLYNVWSAMKQRCLNPNNKRYKDYGGRGISVCAEWNDFNKFESWAVSHGYNPDAAYGECTIDRIDVDGNYEPSNCRWVSLSEQANNKRKNECAEQK